MLYDRHGQAERGVLIIRSSDMRRGMAMVSAADTVAMHRLLDPQRNAVGQHGLITLDAEGLPVWQFTAQPSV